MNEGAKQLNTYKILATEYIDELEAAVTYYILKGWLPQGGLLAHGSEWLQAMYKPASNFTVAVPDDKADIK